MTQIAMIKSARGKVTIGCVLYLFCTLGLIGIYMAGYAFFPGTYGVDITLVSTSLSVSALFGFLSSLVYTSINRKIHAKGMLYLGIALSLIASCGLCFLSGFSGLLISFAIFGMVNGISTYTVITEIISNWFIEKRADKIALTIAAGAFGMAAYQLVGGYVFNMLGLRWGFLAIGIFNAVILTLITKFLIVADNPEKVGEKA